MITTENISKIHNDEKVQKLVYNKLITPPIIPEAKIKMSGLIFVKIESNSVKAAIMKTIGFTVDDTERFTAVIATIAKVAP